MPRQGHQPFEGAVVAADAGEAAAVRPAAEEVAELPLDERRHARPVGAGCGSGEERLQVLAHHLVEDGSLRVAGRVLH